MKTLERMVSMAGLNLDTARRELADLEAVRDDLSQRVIRIDGEISSEMVAAETNPGMLQNLGGYLKNARDKQARLRASIADLEGQIEPAREKVSEAFREKKRFEQVLDTRRTEQKREAGRREQATMDEIGLRQSSQRRAG
jgi:flagellar FliJ protein